MSPLQVPRPLPSAVGPSSSYPSTHFWCSLWKDDAGNSWQSFFFLLLCHAESAPFSSGPSSLNRFSYLWSITDFRWKFPCGSGIFLQRFRFNCRDCLCALRSEMFVNLRTEKYFWRRRSWHPPPPGIRISCLRKTTKITCQNAQCFCRESIFDFISLLSNVNRIW